MLEEGDDEEEGDENGAPNNTRATAAAPTPTLAFDSTKFDLSNFAVNLPLAADAPSIASPAVAASLSADN